MLFHYIYFVSLAHWANGIVNEENQAKYLTPGNKIKYLPTTKFGFHQSSFQIYCYAGKPKYLVNVFNTVTLQLHIDNDDFNQYEGNDPESVKIAYDAKRSIFSFNFFANRRKIVRLNPFNQSCIGIEAESPYEIQLVLLRIDFWRVSLFAVGLLTFFFASNLAKNVLFYYLTGIAGGVTMSFLIVIYLVSKLIPRKPMMWGAMIGGWTLSLYFGQMLFDNIRVILVTYQMYVFWYITLSSFISFLVLYKIGPPKSIKSQNLIRWGLQFAALIMIFFSSFYQEATAGLNILICLMYYFPTNLVKKTKSVWRRRFPPKQRLLTSEEFYEQGVHETTKALEELRKYCSSPEAKPWRTMLKLKDPSRFASFIEGESHLRDDEILDFEMSNSSIEEDDEESNISEDDDLELSEEEVDAPAQHRGNYNSQQNTPISQMRSSQKEIISKNAFKESTAKKKK